MYFVVSAGSGVEVVAEAELGVVSVALASAGRRSEGTETRADNGLRIVRERMLGILISTRLTD